MNAPGTATSRYQQMLSQLVHAFRLTNLVPSLAALTGGGFCPAGTKKNCDPCLNNYTSLTKSEKNLPDLCISIRQ